MDSNGNSTTIAPTKEDNNSRLSQIVFIIALIVLVLVALLILVLVLYLKTKARTKAQNLREPSQSVCVNTNSPQLELDSEETLYPNSSYSTFATSPSIITTTNATDEFSIDMRHLDDVHAYENRIFNFCSSDLSTYFSSKTGSPRADPSFTMDLTNVQATSGRLYEYARPFQPRNLRSIDNLQINEEQQINDIIDHTFDQLKHQISVCFDQGVQHTNVYMY